MKNVEQFLIKIASHLKGFIAHKNQLHTNEVRDGGRQFTSRKAINPVATIRYIAAITTEPNHETALEIRNETVANAKYLLRLVEYTQQAGNGFANILSELARQYHYFSKHNIQYMKKLDPSFSAAKKDLKNLLLTPPDENEALSILWPLFLNTRASDEFTKGGDYSLTTALTLDPQHKITTSCTETLLLYLFFNLNRHKNQHIGMSFDDVYPETNRFVSKFYHPQTASTPVDRHQEDNIKLREALKIPHEGHPLKDSKKIKDLKMRMKLDIDLFSEFTICTITQNYRPIGKDNLPLADGWYQHVFLADYEKYDPDTQITNIIRDEVRYFPCSPKSGPLPYSKYISHSQLSGGLNLYAAGAFQVKKGAIILIDNRSGHYYSGKSELIYARTILRQKGFPAKLHLPLDMPKGMTFSQGVRRLKKKNLAQAFGHFAASSSSDVEIAQQCEGRLIPPTHLLGPHLDHPDPKRKLGYLHKKIQLLSNEENGAVKAFQP